MMQQQFPPFARSINKFAGQTILPLKMINKSILSTRHILYVLAILSINIAAVPVHPHPTPTPINMDTSSPSLSTTEQKPNVTERGRDREGMQVVINQNQFNNVVTTN